MINNVTLILTYQQRDKLDVTSLICSSFIADSVTEISRARISAISVRGTVDLHRITNPRPINIKTKTLYLILNSIKKF